MKMSRRHNESGRVVPRALALAVAVGLLVCSAPGQAGPLKLAALFTDHMVVQRGMPIPFYGSATPDNTVSVRLDGELRETKADPRGAWRVEFPALEAGGPHTVIVSSGGAQVTLENVMAGDVWICSGQSNMAWPVNTGVLHVRDGDAEAAAANWPDIRLLTAGAQPSDEIQPDIKTLGWQVCSPQSVSTFSGVGYFFGRELHKHLGVPIGLICSAAGGTIVESWTSRKGLGAVPEMAELLKEFQASAPAIARLSAEFDAAFDRWQQAIYAADPGYENGHPIWIDPALDTSRWPVMALPAYWEEAGHPGFDGTMWFRRDVEIPESWAGRDLRLRLAAVNDRARIWIDGGQIVDWAGNAQAEAGFAVPGGLVHSKKINIVVRIYDMGGNGGIFGSAENLWLRPEGAGPEDAVSLAGEWRYHLGFRTPSDFPKMPRPPAVHPENPNMPMRLYNGMIAPLTRSPICGAIWYQGEANTRRSAQYRELFPALIRDWRAQWGQGDFPFLFVQLANFESATLEGNLGWAELREAQAMTLALPDTGMAVTIDIGEAGDVHPRNKQDVGRRLALAARHVAYGEDLVYSGPIFESAVREGSAFRIQFKHAGGGLVVRPQGEVTGFEVAADDQKFHAAKVRVEDGSVVVWSDDVPDPVAVRYAWGGNPPCSLYNTEGLPASPFRSDNWAGVTDGKTLALPKMEPE